MSRKEFDALLDEVEQTPGWRVEKLDSSRWRVYPPKPHPVIHICDSGEVRALLNTRANLRRAGFRDKENKVQKLPTSPNPPIVASAVVPSPVEAIKADVDIMLNCLGRISDNLSRIEDEGKGVEELKKILKTVLK